MITITLGTIPYQFDRVAQWLDILLKEEVISEPVFLQHGITDVEALRKHKLITTAALLPGEELAEKIQESRLVISHAGQGSTRKLSAQDKSFVVIPRLQQYGEHIDNHQLLFARSVEHIGVTVCDNVESLKFAICNPPAPLKKNLFSGPKLVDFLADKYPRTSFRTPVGQYVH